MKAALLSDRGVVKVAGDDARSFLHGLVSADMLELRPGGARFGGLLTPQGKIIADFIATEAAGKDGGGFFLDVARERAKPLVDRLNLYKLRSRVMVEDLCDVLGVLAAWDGTGTTSVGLAYSDPRLPALGVRIMLPPHRAGDASARLGASLVGEEQYETDRIALGIPRGGADFGYGDAFPHEADMDQLSGVDFAKGCYVGQEVVSRIEHRGIARARIVVVAYEGAAPQAGSAITAEGRTVGTMGTAAGGRGLALLRLDRVAEALSRGEELSAGDVRLRPIKPDWARFSFPDSAKAAE
jgi:tRNA-modifying protein YgfZ